MFQIIAIGILGAVLSLTVKAYRPEFSIYISIACGILLFVTVLSQLTDIMAYINEIFNKSGYGKTYFPILLKVLAIAYLTDFITQICRDAGENGIASKTEMAGKIFILYVSLPVFTSIVSMLEILLEVGR
ncbi:MAG: stage III sporulation protein AD [Firmicutes bacterium]|nr:stage III sporulation protein AD [Bacillota bacterium]